LHTIKGGSGAIGAKAFYETIKTLEKASKSGDFIFLQNNIHLLTTNFEILRNSLEDWVRKL